MCDDLREWDYGDYEGKTTDEIRAQRPGWSLWRDGVPGGETADEVGPGRDRVIVEGAGTDRRRARVRARPRAARGRGPVGGAVPPTGRLFTLAPATISVLGWERDTAVVSPVERRRRVTLLA